MIQICLNKANNINQINENFKEPHYSQKVKDHNMDEILKMNFVRQMAGPSFDGLDSLKMTCWTCLNGFWEAGSEGS